MIQKIEKRIRELIKIVKFSSRIFRFTSTVRRIRILQENILLLGKIPLFDNKKKKETVFSNVASSN